MFKEQQVQEQIQQHSNGSSIGAIGKSKGKKYNLLPQSIHDTMHNDWLFTKLLLIN